MYDTGTDATPASQPPRLPAGMRRRGATVLIGALLVTVLTYLVGFAQVPYVELVPGKTYDTLGKDDAGKDVIVLGGAPSSTSQGQLRFLTVGVHPELTLLQAIVGWWNDSDAVVPRELVYPPGQTEDEVEKHNAEDFAASESAAKTVAFGKLGYPMKITIKSVQDGLPARGKLQPGDVLKTVNGTTIDANDRLYGLLQSKPVGTSFSFVVDRAGTATTVELATVAGEGDRRVIGVTSEEVSTAPFTVDIPIENIGGPSAGLMLTLGIIDKVKPEDLTGGKIVAGTGTMDGVGNVGPIGGVPQKLIAAQAAGAAFFLTPAANCAEAVSNQKPGLPLVKVGTVDEALNALADIRAGKMPPLCPGATG